jgi:integrase
MSEAAQSHRDAAAALAALLDEIPDAVPSVPPPAEDDVVEAEIVDDDSPAQAPGGRLPVPVEPAAKELILRGRVALAETVHNPDDWVDVETEEELRSAIPENTLAAMHWALGAARWYCQERKGFAVREYMPMTVATVRNWIKDHWTMTRADGQLRGRRGRPYSPNTVKTRIYLMAKIWKLKGYVSPVGHPKVQLQLRAYRRKYEQAGFKPDEAYPLSHAESVALGRACQEFTVGGVRNRAAFRLQYDTGMRASEMLGMRIEDITWSVPDWAPPGYRGPLNATIRIRRSKTDQDAVGREVGVEYVPYEIDEQTEQPRLDADGKPVPHPDVDMDPAVLLARWVEVLRERGITEGRVWRNATGVGEPLQFKVVDGEVVDFDRPVLGGEILDAAWTYEQYEAALKWFAKKAGIDVDPVTGEKRRITSHANRAGHITTSLDGGEPVEKVALRTGHSPTGSIHGYYRNKRRFGTANTGAQIRRRVVRRRVT